MVNFLIGIMTTLSIYSIETYTSIEANNELTEINTSAYSYKYSDIKAFQILDNKCNVCHRKRNQRRIFTKENMETWANDIYKQVFVKKRMPKGKNIKLSSNEYQELLTWISTTKKNQNGIKF
ncbi:MAG: hypothetical protein GY823_08320 [Flavobacteriaceae bacterium]|nr:hypothetical protein [Flavobacteriaceae bacterium]